METSVYAEKNRRIAQNTLMLYIRMFLIMAVSLFTFRILLNELGEVNYGTYNVVGGVVILFTFFNSAMTQSTQRYISYWLGKNDESMLKRVFSTSINVHIAIAAALLLLSETIGLWVLNTYLKFPPENIFAVNCVYQCSIATFILQIMTVPYQATIISHERMTFYAYFSIVEVFLKLGAVIALPLFNFDDRLIVYPLILVVISIIILNIYHLYCKQNFKICHYSFGFDKKLFKELFGFSGWNMLGGIGNVGANQGVNLIFNIFCGVAVNATMGVAHQINAALSSFTSNILTAFNPQIVKSFASDDKDYFLSLIFRASRFSFLLIFIIGIPICICCQTIFEIWLTVIPEYTIQFTQLIVIFCMIDAMSGSLWTAVQASGRIKLYMLLMSVMILSNVPVAYIFLKHGLSPVTVMEYKVVMNLIIHFTRIFYLYWLIDFPAIKYIKDVMCPILVLVLLALPLPLYLASISDSLISQICLIILTVTECSTLGFYILLNKKERKLIINKIKDRF